MSSSLLPVTNRTLKKVFILTGYHISYQIPARLKCWILNWSLKSTILDSFPQQNFSSLPLLHQHWIISDILSFKNKKQK